MSDIVERLRWIGSRTSWESADQQCNEAADEIERLRAEIAKLRQILDELAIARHAQLQARLQLEVRSGTQ